MIVSKILGSIISFFKNSKLSTKLIMVIIILLGLCAFQWNSNKKQKIKLSVATQNIKALNDSLRISENKNFDLVVSRNILIIKNKKELDKLLGENNELSKELDNFKGKIKSLTKVLAEIKNDTIEIKTKVVKYPDGSQGLSWENEKVYDEDNSRELAGESKFKIENDGKITALETLITKDVIKISIVTGLREKDNNYEIFVSSPYPNFTISKLDGALISKESPIFKKFQKRKRFGIGPYLGLGLDQRLIPILNVGIGIQYNIIRF